MGKQNSTGTYQNLLLEARNGVGIVWLNRPELRNALNADMVRELKAALRQLEQDDSVRAIVDGRTNAVILSGAATDITISGLVWFRLALYPYSTR